MLDVTDSHARSSRSEQVTLFKPNPLPFLPKHVNNFVYLYPPNHSPPQLYPFHCNIQWKQISLMTRPVLIYYLGGPNFECGMLGQIH